MSTLSYTFHDLNEIADMFNDNAQVCDRNTIAAKTLKDKALHKREAYAWRQAADILRHTIIITE